MKRIISTICLLFLLLNSAVVALAAREMCEGNYLVSIKDGNSNTITFDIKSAGITAYSPLRQGNVGTGAEDLVAITSQFNQPRYESSVERSHKGVDLRTLSNGVGRDVFLVYSNARIMTASSRSGYGNTVVAQHEYIDANGNKYYFQSLYAHLASMNLSPTNSYSLSYTNKVGQSGNSGLGTNGAIHLHLEFRTAIDVNGNLSGLVNYTYAPSVFYWRKGAWGNNTSFINAVGYSGNTVQFDIVSYDSGVAYDVPANKVKIYHKLVSESSFRSSTMTKSGNTFSYTFSTSDYPVGSTVQYYIEAQEKQWNGTYYKAYRPYYYRESTPPASECFEHSMVSNAKLFELHTIQNNSKIMGIKEAEDLAKQSNISLEPVVDVGYVTTVYPEELCAQERSNIRIGATITEVESNIIKAVDTDMGKEYEIKLNFSLDYEVEEGSFYWITGILNENTNTIEVEVESLFHSPQRYAHTD